MTKKPLISVVVTCYNNAKFLEKCLKSLAKQTLQDIEIICIDDASTDDSLAILKTLAKNDARIKVLHNSENQGVSASRNRATSEAKADYIMYCDADDYYDSAMCEKLYHAITNHDADLAICEVNIIYESHPEMKISDDNYYSLKYHGLQLINDDLMLNTDLAPTNKIFKKSLLEKYQIRFPEGLHFEDAYFCMAYFCVSKTVFYLNERLYHYIRRENSIMSQTWSDDKTDFAIDHLHIAFRFYDFLETHGLTEQYNDLFWQVFFADEFFALENSKTPARIKQVKQEASNFINEHQSSFQSINPSLQEEIKKRSSAKFYLSNTRLKHILLKLMPTYRLEIENIHSLRTLRHKNQELIDEINHLNKAGD